MTIFVAALAVLCFAGIKFSFAEGFEDYMSPAKTGAVKGLFVIIVLFSHTRQYISVGMGTYDAGFTSLMKWLGQLMVVMFLMYSGYGVFLAVKNKEGYIKGIPVKRAFKVWYHFAAALILYFVLGLCLGKPYTIKTYLLSTVGIGDMGNSAWFIIVILLLYLATFAAFIITGRKRMLAGTVLTTVLCGGIMLALMYFKKSDYWWYDTVMCYPLGMWYAMAKPKIDEYLLKDFNKWFSVTAITVTAFCLVKFMMPKFGNNRLIFAFDALLFGLLVVLISMRVSIDNPVLRWLGKRVMGVYILQRIPMIILGKLGVNAHPVRFTLITIAVTVALAEIFERLMDKTDILLRLSKSKKK